MPRTLDEMTPAEQDQCVGMWCELLGASYLVILASPDDPYDGYATVMIPGMAKAKTTYTPKGTLTPRFDLPRAWTPGGETVTEDTPEPEQPQPEDVKPEPSPTRPVTLTTESELLLAPRGTIIRGPETWDFYPYTKYRTDEWVGANESQRFTANAEDMAGSEWTVLYMPEVGS